MHILLRLKGQTFNLITLKIKKWWEKYRSLFLLFTRATILILLIIGFWSVPIVRSKAYEGLEQVAKESFGRPIYDEMAILKTENSYLKNNIEEVRLGVEKELSSIKDAQSGVISMREQLKNVVEEAAKEQASSKTTPEKTSSANVKQNTMININTANASQLDSLPGIGPSTAQKIITYREEKGKFNSIEDIKNVSGIGESTFEKLRNLIEI